LTPFAESLEINNVIRHLRSWQTSMGRPCKTASPTSATSPACRRLQLDENKMELAWVGQRCRLNKHANNEQTVVVGASVISPRTIGSCWRYRSRIRPGAQQDATHHYSDFHGYPGSKQSTAGNKPGNCYTRFSSMLYSQVSVVTFST